jgi:hypothetical protein
MKPTEVYHLLSDNLEQLQSAVALATVAQELAEVATELQPIAENAKNLVAELYQDREDAIQLLKPDLN